MANFFLKKDVNRLIADVADGAGTGQDLKRTLGAFNLIMLGVGAIIGAGIFSLTGTAAAYYAGPGIVYSFIIGGILCAFAGLCYAEMAAMVPVSGSAYAYSYATLGELVAWIIGWDLVLEYAFGSVTVAASWSGYFFSLITKTLGIPLTDGWIRLSKGPWELVTLNDGTQVLGLWNLPATLVSIFLAWVLYRGIQESAFINNLIVVVKISIILTFIALGWAVVDPLHWVGNSEATGFARLVPPATLAMRNGREVMSFGWPGVLTGAGVVFFAYIGFDAVSTTAQECKNPSRDLPIGILVSLVVCTVLYILMALVLTGVVPYQELGVPDPIAVGVDRIVALRGWSEGGQKMFSFAIKVGALAGLTSVILVLMLGQTRIFYAMAKDGEIWVSGVHIPEYNQGSWTNHTPRRDRKLLLHKREIAQISGVIKQGGLTLVPLSLYFKDGKVKVEIAVAKGKKAHDKRNTLMEQQMTREVNRELSRRTSGKSSGKTSGKGKKSDADYD
jgi:APA family basic amino acid/polyamine antiporter